MDDFGAPMIHFILFVRLFILLFLRNHKKLFPYHRGTHSSAAVERM